MPEPLSFETTDEVRDHCLCLGAQRAARALSRQFDLAFRPLGITSGQFSLMMALNQPQPPAPGTVARILAMDRTTVTAAVKPLQRRGLVASLTDPADRRGRLLRLTAAGRALLAAALPIWRKTHADVDAGLAAFDGGLLRAGLAAVLWDQGQTLAGPGRDDASR